MSLALFVKITCMKTDLALSLWFDNDFDDKPHRLSSRDKLLRIETEIIRWHDAGIRAPFEILLARWVDNRQIASTAYVRPLHNGALPHVALGQHKADGPRHWKGGPMYEDEGFVRRHLQRSLPALLRRGLWGRILWLDRELQLTHTNEGVVRLYLGANGQGEWFVPGLAERYNVSAGFDWSSENRAWLLLKSNEQELLDWVYARAEDLNSDLSFSLNWVAWGATRAAHEKRVAFNFRFARDGVEELCHVLRLILQCEPAFADLNEIRWEIDPLTAPAISYGENGDCVTEHLVSDNRYCPIAPLARRIREWAHGWFGVELNEELRAHHRCVRQIRGELILVVERKRAPSAHEQIEAFAQLRDFLAARVAADELRALLKVS